MRISNNTKPGQGSGRQLGGWPWTNSVRWPLCLATLIALCLGTMTASAAELEVRDQRIVWTPGRIPSRAYFTLVNHSSRTVTLTAADSPDFARIRFKAAPDSDLFVLEALDMPRLIGPGDSIKFFDGGPYLILYLGDTLLEPDTSTTITLRFAGRDSLTFPIVVRK